MVIRHSEPSRRAPATLLPETIRMIDNSSRNQPRSRTQFIVDFFSLYSL